MHEALLNEIYDYDIERVHKINIKKIKTHSENNTTNLKKEYSSRVIKRIDLGKINQEFKKNYSHRVEGTDIKVKELESLKNNSNNQSDISFVSDNNKHQKKSLQNPEEIIEFLNERKTRHKLEFSYYEIIKIYLCCKNCFYPNLRRKYNLYKKSKSYVLDVLDITFSIQKIEELEKLKIVVFSPEQLALFNYISKQLISLDENKIANHKLSSIKSCVNNQEELIRKIINVKNRMNSNEEVNGYDRKLFELIDDELKY